MLLKTKELTAGSMGCAVSVLLLFICSVIPSGKLTIGFIASFIPCILYIECKSAKTALISGIASAIISAILLPKQGLTGVIIVFYCLCFSYYPGLKAHIEKKRNIYIEWIIKEIYYFALSFIVKLVTLKLGLEFYNIFVSVILLTAYDILLSYVIGYYIRVISPRIQKSR
jgi:hypothetical protein